MNLSSEQQHAIESGHPVPVKVNQIECVVIRRDVYEQLKDQIEHDEWTTDEMDILAAEAAERLDRAERFE